MAPRDNVATSLAERVRSVLEGAEVEATRLRESAVRDARASGDEAELSSQRLLSQRAAAATEARRQLAERIDVAEAKREMALKLADAGSELLGRVDSDGRDLSLRSPDRP